MDQGGDNMQSVAGVELLKGVKVKVTRLVHGIWWEERRGGRLH